MEFKNIAQAKKDFKVSYLGGINLSSKMLKNKKISKQYTYILYLSPANSSGYQVCSHSTKECRLGCLNTSGRAAMEIKANKSVIHDSRVKKTRLLFENTKYFMNWLIAEIKHYEQKAINDNYGFSIRLNGTSDVNWTKILLNGKNIFEIFPNVNFYDYTKIPEKFINKPLNYHLTFSYSGRNGKLCKELLEAGVNVAVVFNVKKNKPLPKTFGGYEVVNGDATDYRIDDAKGVIVGLRFKEIANKQTGNEIKHSVFVINENVKDFTQFTNVLN